MSPDNNLGTEELLSFSDALAHIMNGKRVGAKFLPVNTFIAIQWPDGGSMNTEPYLKFVQVEFVETENTGSYKVVKCVPWEPGQQSVMSNEWFISPYNDLVF